MSNFGDLVRRLRKERSLTLEAVARRVGSHKGYISGIENGKVNPPSVKFIRKFARLFQWDERRMVMLAYTDKAPKLIREEIARLLVKASGETIPLLNTIDTGYATELRPDGTLQPLTQHSIGLPRNGTVVSYAATLCDSSMEPGDGAGFSRGDVVLLTPEVGALNGAVVYAVFKAREKRRALVRQVMLEQNDQVVLQPLNKDYPLEFLTRADVEAAYRVVGKIEWYHNGENGTKP